MKKITLIALIVASQCCVSLYVSSAEFQSWINTDLTWATSWRSTYAESEWRPHGYAVVQSEVWGIVRQGPAFAGFRVTPLVQQYMEWEKSDTGQILGAIGGVDIFRALNASLSLSGWIRFTNNTLAPEESFRVFSSAHLAYRVPIDDDFYLRTTMEGSFEYGSSYEWLETEVVCVAQPLPWIQVKLGGFLGMRAGGSYDDMYCGIVAGISGTLRGDSDRPSVPLLH